MVGVLVRPASVVRWLTETNLTQTEMSDAVPVPAGCWWYLVLSSSHAGSPGFLSAPKKVVITDTFFFLNGNWSQDTNMLEKCSATTAASLVLFQF